MEEYIVIEVTNLKKSYGPIEALRGVSFNIAEGEIVGLLGPNGAGKTTIIKTLTGYLQPDEGTVMVNGLDVLDHTREIQAQIGYLPETAPLYPELTIQTYLQMIADLRQVPEEEKLHLLSEAVYATGLPEHLTRPIGELSKGFRQRVGLAQAILHKPKLLILDEPTIGLDPTQIVEIRHLIQRLSRHSTVLFSTHILSEVEALCDRAIILINGEIKADARLSELAATSDAVLVLDTAVGEVVSTLESLEDARGVTAFEWFDGYPAYRVYGKPDAGCDLGPAIFTLAREHNWPVRELRRDMRTLEMVFNELALSAQVSELAEEGAA
jgi:ABC-2 type transport system ATP-binding protein